MSTTADLVSALKHELKAARMTYADLAVAMGMAESSVKRMLAKGDMPLSRIDAICRALKLDFADLARRVAEPQQQSLPLDEPEAPAGMPPAMAGKKCSECGAHAVIRKDGCDYCTQCGHLGSCG